MVSNKNIKFIWVLASAAIVFCVVVLLIVSRPSSVVRSPAEKKETDEMVGESEKTVADNGEEDADPTLEDNLAEPAEAAPLTENQKAKLNQSNQDILHVSAEIKQVGRKLQAAQDSAIYSDEENTRLVEEIKANKVELEKVLDDLPQVAELREEMRSARAQLDDLLGRIETFDSSEDRAGASVSREELNNQRHELEQQILTQKALMAKTKRDAMERSESVKEVIAEIEEHRKSLANSIMSDKTVARILEEREELISKRDQMIKERAELIGKFRSEPDNNNMGD